MARDRQRDALEARQLLDNDLLNFIFAGVEDDAVARVTYAAPADDAARMSGAAEIRAIRDLRQRLQQFVKDGEATPRPKRGTPA